MWLISDTEQAGINALDAVFDLLYALYVVEINTLIRAHRISRDMNHLKKFLDAHLDQRQSQRP